ncbi:GTP:AMP phosphotransferase AK3, mitochondrial-like [Paramacrobiotus metropolitanus]|uniref:GTP:AMP phosphotransferase AK3, mitochondrial-like n=1 Tax=Paramacrobiotus metropolitanus TaxID=2943436 RepID=UPI0024458E3A|nr:GTP:AMP phosphotransferase AK3, mitochondrial-like [Paramacrobiotus metropolitanus]
MSLSTFRVIILGAPGSGKGTIASRICKTFQLNHIISGDILRKEQQNQSELGKKLAEYIKSGALVPDDIMIRIMGNEMKNVGNKWLLDGFPRTYPQADKLHKEVGMVDSVVNLDIPFDVIRKRLEGRFIHAPSGRTYNLEFNPPKVSGKDDITGEPIERRADDEPEVVMARLKTYKERTEPLLDYYRKAGVLKEFQGTESNVIWPFVKEYLEQFISQLDKQPKRKTA